MWTHRREVGWGHGVPGSSWACCHLLLLGSQGWGGTVTERILLSLGPGRGRGPHIGGIVKGGAFLMSWRVGVQSFSLPGILEFDYCPHTSKIPVAPRRCGLWLAPAVSGFSAILPTFFKRIHFTFCSLPPSQPPSPTILPPPSPSPLSR